MSGPGTDCDATNDDIEFRTQGSADELWDDLVTCQTAVDCAPSSGDAIKEKVTLERLCAMQATFAVERDWNQFHTPRNLLLALVIGPTPLFEYSSLYKLNH